MERVACEWRGLHASGEAYMRVESVTCEWRGLYVSGEGCMRVERVTCDGVETSLTGIQAWGCGCQGYG